jgi:hypothetical protein
MKATLKIVQRVKHETKDGKCTVSLHTPPTGRQRI